MRGKTVIERHFAKTKPTVGTDEHRVLTAMMISRFTLLRLGEAVRGVGVHVVDVLFGGAHFLADIQLSKYKEGEHDGDAVIATRLLAFDDLVMTPCTSYLPFDAGLAQMLAVGLPKGIHRADVGEVRVGRGEARARHGPDGDGAVQR
jgi:hypothetical protein